MAAGKYGRYGISTVIGNLSIQLQRLGHDVTIGAFSFSEKPPAGVNFEKLFSPTLMTLNRQYDVIHSHQPSTNFLAAIVKTPFIYEYHGCPYGFLNFSRLNTEFSLRFIRFLKKKVIAISQTAADELIAFKDLDVEIVPHGVDNQRFFGAKGVYRKGKPHLLFVGHLHPHKRVDELISSMTELVTIYPDAYLQIIGSGGEIGNLKAQVSRLSLTRHVGFLEWVPEAELPAYYASCDVYVSASRWEMFGLPSLEAMACCKPVVVSFIPAHWELIQKSNAGLLYTAGDTNDLVRKISEVYNRKKYFGQNALQFAEKNDWSVVANHIVTIYSHMLNN